MLTLILLAVLGGGLGLLAVSLAERQPAMVRDGNRRGADGADGADEPDDERHDGPDEEAPEEPAGEPVEETTGEPEPEVVFVVPEPTRPSAPAPPPRVAPPERRRRQPASTAMAMVREPRRVARRPDGVRRSQAAVEGAFGDVGVASIPRRVLALVGVVLVVLGVGVMVAVVVGAAVGAGVELFDQTFR